MVRKNPVNLVVDYVMDRALSSTVIVKKKRSLIFIALCDVIYVKLEELQNIHLVS